MKIRHHPHIDKQSLEILCKFHDAIDLSLSLHYTTNSRLLTAHELFDRVAKLLQTRTKIENFLLVLMVDKYQYKLIDPQGCKDYSPCYVTIFGTVKEFNANIEIRKGEFIFKLNTWIVNNSHIGFLDIPKVQELIELHNDTSKLTKPRTPTKISKVPILKNDSSKFTFKPKDEKTELKRTGLTFIERIRLKEKLLKEDTLQNSPEMKREAYLNGKLVPIYNILFQMNTLNENESFKSYSLATLTATIKDSLDYPIHIEEVHDVLKLLQTKLSNKVDITTKNNLSLVKVYKLDRTKDLYLLNL